MSHVLVTNDFPPKVGGIQTYLWELWRRLPEGQATVLTTRHPDSATWDAAQPFPVHRVAERLLVPRRSTLARVRRLALDSDAKLVVLDPALPIGLIGPELGIPYVLVLHGAEVTVPGRLPVSRQRLARVLRGARGIIAAGAYPLAEAVRAAGGVERMGEAVEIPPGVDTARFRPLDPDRRRLVRRRLDLPESGLLVVTASRLVPRKGMDVIIEALPHVVAHHPDLTLAVAGSGRDARRLRTI
ncbi:MAG: glycosyltransferase family 4 protein, partial [Acidimicrobiales bacterium]